MSFYKNLSEFVMEKHNGGCAVPGMETTPAEALSFFSAPDRAEGIIRAYHDANPADELPDLSMMSRIDILVMAKNSRDWLHNFNKEQDAAAAAAVEVVPPNVGEIAPEA